MSAKENQLVAITAADLTTNDFVRVLDNQASRRITVGNFTEALDPLLVDLGFIKSVDVVTTKLLTVSGSYTMDGSVDIIACNTSVGDLTITLPLAAQAADISDSPVETKIFRIKKITGDINRVSIVPQGVSTIDGQTSIDIIGPELGYINIFSDGFNWYSV